MIEVENGWEIIVEIKNEFIRDIATILIDYNHLPIHCKFCFDYSHQTKDYSILVVSKNKGLKTKKLGGKPPIMRNGNEQGGLKKGFEGGRSRQQGVVLRKQIKEKGSATLIHNNTSLLAQGNVANKEGKT
jgi:hypothetical protein